MSVTRVAYTAEGWGTGELWFEHNRLVWHELPRPQPIEAGSERTRPAHPHPFQGRGSSTRHPLRSTIAGSRARRCDGWDSVVDRLLHRVHSYFSGQRVEFDDVRIDLDELTPFQRAIAGALRRVPYGTVVSYGDLAREAGYPNAQRAAGTFCARNRYPLVLPCHRVVAVDGIGGYGSLGASFKRRLLALEGVTV